MIKWTIWNFYGGRQLECYFCSKHRWRSYWHCSSWSSEPTHMSAEVPTCRHVSEGVITICFYFVIFDYIIYICVTVSLLPLQPPSPPTLLLTCFKLILGSWTCLEWLEKIGCLNRLKVVAVVIIEYYCALALLIIYQERYQLRNL